MKRLNKDVYFMSIALAVSARSTCLRRSVGCIVVDEQGRVMSTGYNGVPRGHPHCIDEPCLGANMPSGEGLDLCRAIHAETNALQQCTDILKIHSVYTTSFPCVHCLKQLANTSMRELHYLHDYPTDRTIIYPITIFEHKDPILTRLEEIYNAQRQSEGSNQLGKDPRLEAAIRAAATGERETSKS